MRSGNTWHHRQAEAVVRPADDLPVARHVIASVSNSPTHTTAVLTYSARGYDSTVCCSKMSRDTFLNEALYEEDKALEKIAAAPQECVRTEQTVNHKCMFYFVILRNMSINSLHLCLRLLCRLLHC